MRKYSTVFIIILLSSAFIYLFIQIGDKAGLDFTSSLKDEIGDAVGGSGTDSNGEKQEIDKRPLEIEYKSTPREILESQHAITIKSNKEITLRENNRVELVLVLSQDDHYYYVAEINNLAAGDTNLKFVVYDQAENEEEIRMEITRKRYGLPLNADKIEDWEGSSYTIYEESGLLTRISKSKKLVDDYEPENLVDIGKDLLLYANVEGLLIEKSAGEALRQMALDLQSQTGKTLTILSGYRSHNDQVETYTNNVKTYGQQSADTFSARPGFSDHQLGTVVDFYSPDTGSDIFSEIFDDTVAGQWLLNNAHKYGFVQTYPKGSEEKTGYAHEPWQYRYIGVDKAKEVKESGLIFFDWLENSN